MAQLWGHDHPRAGRTARRCAETSYAAWAGTSGSAFGLLGAGGRFCPFGRASGGFAPFTAELARERQDTVRAGTGGSPEELAALAGTALAEAARAHAAIEARETVGKTLLTVH
jgi:NADPH2:quinone reductase